MNEDFPAQAVDAHSGADHDAGVNVRVRVGRRDRVHVHGHAGQGAVAMEPVLVPGQSAAVVALLVPGGVQAQHHAGLVSHPLEGLAQGGVLFEGAAVVGGVGHGGSR